MCDRTPHMPKLAFLKFKLANKVLTNSNVYKSCQQKLLTAEIEEKKRVINVHKNHHYKLLSEIKQQVNLIYFTFLIYNDKNIRKCKKVQDHKILKLGTNSLSRNNPNKVITFHLLLLVRVINLC